MIKNLTYLFILIIFTSSIPKEKELIEYNENRELSWKDYKGRPNKASSFKALTTTRIIFSANSNGTVLNLSLKNAFEPKSSWTKSTDSQKLLEHERLHFHISELFARKLRKEILDNKFKANAKKAMSEVSKLYEQCMTDLTQYQRKYDRETDHSINEKKQEEWESTVIKELKRLQNYHNSEIEILLK